MPHRLHLCQGFQESDLGLENIADLDARILPAFPMAAWGQLPTLPDPFRFIVSYHDRSTLLQKIDRNKERVFSMPLDYASLNA